jgi:hypothetical protein
MADAQNDFEFIRARIDEHGRIIDQHGVAINGLVMVVQGDSTMRVKGLLERTEAIEKIADEFQQLRRDVSVYWKSARIISGVIIALLSIPALATLRDWLPVMSDILDLLP